MKKLLKWGLCLSMAFCLIGCSNQDNTPQDPIDDDEEEIIVAPKNINMFTGLADISETAIGKRPVCVAINNVSASLPQYGVSSADLIYEFPVEYGLTRLLGFWGDYTKVPDLCSVRSSRYFFPITAMGYDAFYVHWGYYYPDQSYINSLDFDEFEGLYNQGNLYGRDQDRLNKGYALEHTSVFYGTKLAAELENGNYRLDLKESKTGTGFLFAENEVTPSQEACNVAEIDFGSMYSTFTYNEETKTYFKDHNGKDQIDQATGEQLEFKNIFVLESDIRTINSEGRNTIDWSGDEDSFGYYISNGAIKKIHWKKESEDAYLKFYDESGKELAINKGKSYITYTDPGTYTFE